ncbi:Pyruvate carboxylase subunit A [Paraburkholderia piptadeniae]|uniref:Biotin carboxylase n=2 Tax=Paraburkholderia TaxID=1822464 RepID=A0A7X1NBZ2_9BURK|nr:MULTISPECIES: biotin carboxylase N-terminal domain-containing protein [Paraburkholderia]MPW18726.1 biotin carboxylase [Paraburkholderia franconis]SIT48320.1 Pyruvate carboxylase subunit A [Paraburkholderia piptadeniae]
MIRRLLLCCRGEIAMRFIRTCRELGIETAVAYPVEDMGAPYVMAADRRIPLQARTPSEAIPEVIAAAKLLPADAIAPGYGPLAENAGFSALCASEGFVFVGPNVNAIRLSGDKLQARQAAEEAGVPVIPGAMMPADMDLCVSIARQIGFPIIVKAVLGGGGRGIRVAQDEHELVGVLEEVRREAQGAFGSDQVYVERFLGEKVRHIEVQIIADQHGTVLHLGDRECSVQRRRQKLVEEAPAPNLSARVRRSLYRSALGISKAIRYDSAGTVEFLVDPTGRFYFIEMNARIQVEHPVTESVCGVDIVEQMIRVASGEPLALEQDDIHLAGHAIEFRICAEDPLNSFFPVAGVVLSYAVPEGPGIRVDSGITSGMVQSPLFDSLCTKLIVHGRDRTQALFRATEALREFKVVGFPTNVAFHHWLLRHPDFIRGGYNLGLVGEFSVSAPEKTEIQKGLVAIAAVSAWLARRREPSADVATTAAPASPWRMRNQLRSYVDVI